MFPVPDGLKSWAKTADRIMSAKQFPPAAPLHSVDWRGRGNWELICEEILDTDTTSETRMAYDVLIGRGLDRDTIQQMRRFAWLTAGWLNYEMMMWEWVHLDRSDMELAVRLQFEKRLITEDECRQMMEFIDSHEI